MINKPIAIEFRHPESLTPYVKNAKKHSVEQIDKIAGQIAAFGFDQPIVIDKDGVIIKGHGRRQAALRLGLDKVPVIVNELSEHEAMAARIADNKIAISDFDKDLLRFDIHTLDQYNLDLKLTGFDKWELDSLMAPIADLATSAEAEWEGMPEFTQPDKTSFRHVVVHFQNAEDAAAFFTTIGREDTGETRSIWYPEQSNMNTESERYG